MNIRKYVTILLIFVLLLTGCFEKESEKIIISDDNTTLRANDDFININYQFDVILSDDLTSLDAKMNVTFINKIEGLDSLVFHTYTNVYNNLSNDGIGKVTKTGELIIDRIYNSIGDDFEFEYTCSKQNVTVVLNRELMYNEEYSINIDFKVDMPVSTSRLGLSADVMSYTMWHPLLAKYTNNQFDMNDYAVEGESDYVNDASFELKVKHLSKYSLVSGGIDSKEENGNYTMSKASLEHGRIMAFFVSKNFETLSLSYGDGKVIRLFYTLNTIVNVRLDFQALLDKMEECILFYEDIIGEFIYSEYDIVATGVEGFAMEYSGIIQEGYDFDLYWSSARATYNVVFHESGHQYFYSMIGSDSYNDPFIDEGFTEFISAYASDPLKYTYLEQDQRLYENYSDRYSLLGESMEYYDDIGSTLAVYYGVTTVLYKVMKAFGEEMMIEYLRLLYNNYAFKQVTRAEIYSSFETVFGSEAREKFEQLIEEGYSYTIKF